MKHILLVTQNYPHPLVKHGGGQDFWHVIEALCHRYRVYVLTYDDPVKPVPESALSPYVANLHVIRYAITTVDKLVISLVAVHQGFRFNMPRRIWEMRQLIADWYIRYEVGETKTVQYKAI